MTGLRNFAKTAINSNILSTIFANKMMKSREDDWGIVASSYSYMSEYECWVILISQEVTIFSTICSTSLCGTLLTTMK